ncbi:hypothetical protein ABE424_13180 [Stenotrophomonas sp. TWI1149]|uniref:hypothetical protein n=1 Tax=unclassified Stenotrophomonas TaxID=196198 RepID=UPI0032082735
MGLKNILDGLERAPWRAVAKHIFARADYDTSQGYEKTVSAILKQKIDVVKVEALEKALIEHLVAGEKYIQIIKLHPGERKNVEAWIRGKRRHKNVLTEAFPGVGTEAEITPFRHQEPTSAGYVELESGIGALYTAARGYVKSVPVPASDLKPAAAAGFERIVGFKNVVIQAYDAVWLPNVGDYIVLAVDFPSEGPRQNFPKDGAAFLTATVRQMLARPVQKANFWHAIEGLYQAVDGKLVDYGFSAGGQSVNHHRARRRTSLCLRKAIYDAAGAAAVKASGKSLELFKVAMQWSVKHPDGIFTDPEALIPGVAKDLNKGVAVIDHCIVRDCLTTRDLALLVSKLQPHIKNWI